MPAKKASNSIKVQKHDNSSLADFIERPVPSEQEVASFNRAVRQEARDQEIDTNLSEIYKDKHGQMVDVKTLKVKQSRSFVGRFFRWLIIIIILGALAYAAYYFLNQRSNQTAIEIAIQTPEKVISGEEFFYEVSYQNNSRFSLAKINLFLKYPENFIFLESSLPATSQNDSWQLPDLGPGQNYVLKVKGKLINKKDAPNILTAQLSYTPANFSSEFKKETSANTLISGLGFDVEATYLNTALLGQENEVSLVLNNFGDNVYLNNFLLNVSAPSNISITDLSLAAATSQTSSSTGDTLSNASSSPALVPLAVNKISVSQWQVSNLAAKMDKQNLTLKYKVNSKTEDKQSFLIQLEQLTPDGRSLVFFEKSVDLEIMKSDLNLTLAVNDLKADSPVDFGQTLNYVITYANHGATALMDINIRADLKGEFFDWDSLQDKNRGQLDNGGLVWTKEQIPELAEIKPNQEGEIAFSIKLKNFQDSDLGKDLSLSSQASFNLANSNNEDSSSDRRSNTIINKLNSNFDLSEQIRYFDENNIPVGSGPLPPKIGQKTSFRVYWTVTNSLHELSGAKVSLTLPSYVEYDAKSGVNVGSLVYDNVNRQIIWEIGRLPVSVKRVDAAFNISLTPATADLDKILILSPGAVASAQDIETQGAIIKKSSAKTTKLEDDDIANMNNSGQVQP